MAPDLVTEIRSAELTKDRARSIADASRALSIRVHAHRDAGSWYLSIPAVHDLLTEEADWDHARWAMDRGRLGELAETLEWVFTHIPEAFTFEATWDRSDRDVNVSRDELIEIVRRSEIGTRTRYHVAAATE